MATSYTEDLRRIAFLGNEKFDFLIKKSATRWCTNEQMIRELIIAVISDQDEIGCRFIINSNVFLNDSMFWYESDTTHEDACQHYREDDLASTVYVVVYDISEAQPLIVSLEDCESELSVKNESSCDGKKVSDGEVSIEMKWRSKTGGIKDCQDGLDEDGSSDFVHLLSAVDFH